MEPNGTGHKQCNGVGCNNCEDPLPRLEPNGTGHRQCNGVGCMDCEPSESKQVTPPPATLFGEILYLYGQVVECRSLMEAQDMLLAAHFKCSISISEENRKLDEKMTRVGREELDKHTAAILIKEREYALKNNNRRFLTDLFNSIEDKGLVDHIKKVVKLELQDRRDAIVELICQMDETVKLQNGCMTLAQYQEHMIDKSTTLSTMHNEYKEKTGGISWIEHQTKTTV